MYSTVYLLSLQQGSIKGLVYLLSSFVFWSMAILTSSFYITGSWDFISAMYGVM